VHADGVEAYVTECARLGALPQPQVGREGERVRERGREREEERVGVRE